MKKSKDARYSSLLWITGSVIAAALYGVFLYGLYGYIKTHRRSDFLKYQYDVFREAREMDRYNQTYSEYRQREFNLVFLIVAYLALILLLFVGVYCTVRPTYQWCHLYPIRMIIFVTFLSTISAFLVFQKLLSLQNEWNTFWVWFVLLAITSLPLFLLLVTITLVTIYLLNNNNGGLR